MKTLSFDIDEVIKRERIGSELELEHALQQFLLKGSSEGVTPIG